jgi:hypothetical protein
MTVETISGKCPYCGYNKMVMRYGSMGWYRFEGCPNCEFGYGTNNTDAEDFGFDAWYPQALHYLVCHLLAEKEMADDSGGLYDHLFKELESLPHNELRKMLFDYIDQQERSNDVEGTLYVYTEEDIRKHRATHPFIINNSIMFNMFYPVNQQLQL